MKILSLLIVFGVTLPLHSQVSVESNTYNAFLQALLEHSVQEISVPQAYQTMDEFQFIDCRSRSEYNVSHLKNARWVGLEEFDVNMVSDISYDRPLILYCSVGARSERMASKLSSLGYNKVYNLYGGIFEWVNQKYIVYNESGPTDRIHPYSWLWGVWLSEGIKDYGEDLSQSTAE